MRMIIELEKQIKILTDGFNCREAMFAELLAAAKEVLNCGDRGCGQCLNRLEIAVAKVEGENNEDKKV